MSKRKGKGKKIVTDLAAFTSQQEAAKTSEKDIYHQPKEATRPANGKQPEPEVNKCEDEIAKFNPAVLEFSVPSFYYALDNKLIDTYYATRVDVFGEDERDLL